MDVNHDVRGWDEKFSVNVKLFDVQHQRLVALIARLQTAMGEGQAMQEMAGILSDLADYTREHFATEEAVLIAYDFPRRDMHALEHRQFTAELGRLQIQLASGEAAMSVQVLDHLKEWLCRHVLGSDKKYTEHLNARGLF
ncbi:MAG: bacteriohemerythrin [Candidatus Solibacter sp.]|nr:bacteriohemerythrin [Candidatus Solibacter sp.]